MEDKNKISTTKNELQELLREVVEDSFAGEKFKNAVENTFASKKFKDSVEDVVMDTLARFDTEVTRPNLEEAKQDLMKEIQASRDHTDRIVSKSEGNVVSKINILTNVLRDRRVINEREAMSVKRAGLEV